MKEKEYRLGYRGDIEGLRAIAILLVVAAHAGVPSLGGGFVGVDVFFVLSGYLITALLVQEVQRDGRIGFAAFYARRLRRLLPALLFMVVVISLLAALLLAPTEQIPDTVGAASATFWASNLYFAFSHLDYFGPDAGSNLFLHTWSLGVEEQFYLVWPALIALLLLGSGRRLKMDIRRLKIAMSVVAVLSLAACVIWTYSSQRFAFYLMPARAWEFALGALTLLHFGMPAVHTSAQAESVAGHGRVLRGAGVIGVGCILAAAVLFNSRQPFPGIRALLPAIGAALILAAGAREKRGVSRLLACRPLQAIGHVSYSWYLWHWPALLLAGALATQATANPVYRLGAVVLSLLAATFSYFVVESPIRRNRILIARPGRAILAAVALMILVNALCLRWWHSALEWANSPQQREFLQAHVDAPVIYAMGCDDWFHSSDVHICAFGPTHAAHSVVLMGDSIAGQWFPAVAKAFDRPDWRLLVITKSSCPMVDRPYYYARIGREYTECAAWRASALRQVAAMKPDVVIMSSFSTLALDKEQWIGGTSDVLRKITPDVGHVFLLRATPRLPFNGPDCLAARQWRPSLLDFSNGCTSLAHSRGNAEIYSWLKQAANGFGNVTMIDMNDFVCPNRICTADRDHKVVFRDNQHMTASFARSLGEDLAQKMGAQKATGLARAGQ